jgi:lauroyl/myristoyl acyltransferase
MPDTGKYAPLLVDSDLRSNDTYIDRASPGAAPFSRPSSLYAARLWRLGLAVSRILPNATLRHLAKMCAQAYRLANPRRSQIVVENLLPVLSGDRARAEFICRDLFSRFSEKLVDLWRYESGATIEPLFKELTGWSNFERAQSRQQGILLLTIHLGNWEFGAALLRARGIDLQVVTLAEPDVQLTQLRQEARSRRGISTLVISEGQFGFVEIIRRLENGAVVALLMDRPPENSAVTVDLFNRPFRASVAAGELARATGCALLPVCMPAVNGGYAAHVLPEIIYDRGQIGSREARKALTQEIMSAFKPLIEEHPNQWYHFVPVWLR